MTAPVISVLPDAPQRGVDSQEVFTSKANALVDSLATLVSETNTMGTWMNTTSSEVESDRLNSAASATAAGNSANNAAASAANAALSLGDYRGDYSAPTSYITGQSVSYNDSIYIAKEGTTGNLPTNTTYWFKGTGSAAVYDVTTSPTDTTAGRLLTVGAKIEQLDIDGTNVKYEAPCKPTLDLDFANQDFTIYSKTGGFIKSPLADLVSQGRSTAGSSVDAIGGITEFGAGENRFTFDGETGEALGYLSEESRTNFFTNSDQSAVNSAIACTTSTVSAVNPFYEIANITEILINGDASPESYHCRIGSDTIVTAGDFYAGSLYIRSDDGLNVAIDTNDGMPSTHTVDGVWRRISAVSGNTTPHRFLDIRAENGSTGKTFQLACKQIENGQFPTSYIRTLGTAVTRSADSMTRTLGQEWNPNEGTFVVDVDIFRLPNTGAGLISFEGSLASWLFIGSTTNQISMFDGLLASNGGFGVGSTDSLRVAASSTKSLMSFAVNGVFINQSPTSGGLLSQSAFTLPSGNTYRFKEIKYYPRAFDAATLQRLSRIQ